MSSKQEQKRAKLAGIVKAISLAMAAQDYVTARTLIEDGKAVAPNLTGAGGDNAWQTLTHRVNVIAARGASAVPAQPEAPAAPEVQEQPEESGMSLAAMMAPGGPVDGDTSFGTITIVHNADRGTTMLGTAKGDGTRALMTSDGQAWNYTRSYVANGVRQPGYYRVGHTKGYTADMDRIGYATAVLRIGGFTVVHEIDNTGCVDKRDTPARRSRLHSCLTHVRRQARSGRVTPGVDGDEPVSAVPAPTSVAPVSAPPAPVVESVPAPVVEPVVAPVSAPPAPVGPDYASMSDALLLAALVGGDTGALVEVQARMARTAIQHVATIAAAPVPVEAPAPVAEPVMAPVAAPAAAPVAEVPVISRPGYVEIWFPAATKRRLEMNPVALAMRQKLNTYVGDVLEGVTTHVARRNKECAYKVYAEVPEGIDNAEVIDRILSLGFGDPIASPVLATV